MKSMSATCPERPATLRKNAARIGQRGFALVSAIFLLVILAALGAFMVTMSAVQHTTSAQDVLGSRAYQAARTGIEWGVYQVMNPENATPPATQYVCANYNFVPGTATALGGTLAGFTVAVTCASTPYDEGGNLISVYVLTATATSGAIGGTDRVERQITATVGTCRKTANGELCESN
jgi:MSHA biogenesis protein MshP